MIEIYRRDSDSRAATPRLAQVGPQSRFERPTVHAPRERIAPDLLGEARVHRVKAAREQRELVGPPFGAELRQRGYFSTLDDFAVHAQRVHSLPETAERVDQ